jgi:Mce-associated membrane protein
MNVDHLAATAEQPHVDASSDDESAADTSASADDTDDEASEGTEAPATESRSRWRRLFSRRAISPQRAALAFGITALTAVTVLLGWQVVQLHRKHAAEQQLAAYLQAGKQGALNLTTIDWQHADADVERILDSATGRFHDDFAGRAPGFVEVVKQTQSHTEGTILEAGIEHETDSGAAILVAVQVGSTQLGQTDQRTRSWQMRIDVENAAGSPKVQNVEFVS